MPNPISEYSNKLFQKAKQFDKEANANSLIAILNSIEKLELFFSENESESIFNKINIRKLASAIMFK